jgi:hypothetical protein
MCCLSVHVVAHSPMATWALGVGFTIPVMWRCATSNMYVCATSNMYVCAAYIMYICMCPALDAVHQRFVAAVCLAPPHVNSIADVSFNVCLDPPQCGGCVFGSRFSTPLSRFVGARFVSAILDYN